MGTYREDTGIKWASEELINLDKVEKNHKGLDLRLVAEETGRHKSVIKAVLLTHEVRHCDIGGVHFDTK